jgi:MFS transporter, DHA1 family, multidrug resistance protein
MGNASSRRPGAPVGLLGVAAGLGPFTVDSYLPALPLIATQLNAGDTAVQYTLAVTMLGFACGQLVVGPWSDRVGRRVPLVVGLAVLIVASVAAAFAADVAPLLAARFAQGLGASTAAVTALASARDAHSGDGLARAIGIIALIQSIAPLVAPVVGGVVIAWTGWRGVFVALAAYAALTLCLLAWRLPPRPARTGRTISTLGRYRRLTRDRQLIGLLMLAGLRFTALFTLLQWSPFLLQGDLGVPPDVFGVLFAVMTLGMMAGLQLSPWAIRRGVRPRRVLIASFAVMLLGAAVLASAAAVAVVVIGSVVFLLGCGLGLPTIQSLALAEHYEDSGTVAGLIGAVGFGSAALLSPVLALLPASGIGYREALALVVAGAAVASAIVMAALQRGRRPLP